MARLSLALLALLAGCQSFPRPEQAPEGAAPSLYEQRIAPILSERCVSCHGTEKQKGKLQLHTPEAIQKGGLDGAVIVPGKPAQSELVRRLRLPLADEDHMPPKERPQPKSDEIEALASWIASGASFAGGGSAAPAVAPAAALAPKIAPADPKAVAALEQAFVHVEKADPATELLWIDFAANAPKWSDADLARVLEPLAAQIAQLGLARTQAGARTLALCARMPQLERLDLRATPVDDAALAALRGHAKLEQLVLARTKAGDASVETLLALPALQRVYLWQSAVGADARAQLVAARPKLVVDAGDEPAAAAEEIEPAPKFTSEAPLPGAAPKPAAVVSLEPVNKVCPVSGAPLNPKYSIVFEGRVIGFCCNKCPTEFWADPEKFRSKLP